MEVDGDASTVILDANDVVLLEGHDDIGTDAGQNLVDGVIDHLLDEVMEPIDSGRPDVHTGAPADRLETFQYLDAVRGIG